MVEGKTDNKDGTAQRDYQEGEGLGKGFDGRRVLSKRFEIICIFFFDSHVFMPLFP